MFKSLFSRKEPQKLPELLNLTIGRSATVDPIELKLLGKDSLIDPPTTGLNIVAQGRSDLGEHSYLHRFYPDDDRFVLQIQGGDGLDDVRVDEIVLWYVYDVHYPSRSTDWQQSKTALMQTTFDVPTETGSVQFQRVWFDHSDGPEDPMTYWEDVRDTREQVTPRRIFQTAMLFGRGLQDGTDEMLLVNMEEPEKGDRAVSYLIGRALPAHALMT